MHTIYKRFRFSWVRLSKSTTETRYFSLNCVSRQKQENLSFRTISSWALTPSRHRLSLRLQWPACSAKFHFQCVLCASVPGLCYTIKMFSELFELVRFRSLSFPRAVILISASGSSYLLHGCQIRCRYIWASTRHNVTELRSALNNKTRTNAKKTFSMHLLVFNFLFFPLLILFFRRAYVQFSVFVSSSNAFLCHSHF